MVTDEQIIVQVKRLKLNWGLKVIFMLIIMRL